MFPVFFVDDNRPLLYHRKSFNSCLRESRIGGSSTASVLFSKCVDFTDTAYTVVLCSTLVLEVQDEELICRMVLSVVFLLVLRDFDFHFEVYSPNI